MAWYTANVSNHGLFVPFKRDNTFSLCMADIRGQQQYNFIEMSRYLHCICAFLITTSYKICTKTKNKHWFSETLSNDALLVAVMWGSTCTLSVKATRAHQQYICEWQFDVDACWLRYSDKSVECNLFNIAKTCTDTLNGFKTTFCSFAVCTTIERTVLKKLYSFTRDEHGPTRCA